MSVHYQQPLPVIASSTAAQKALILREAEEWDRMIDATRERFQLPPLVRPVVVAGAECDGPTAPLQGRECNELRNRRGMHARPVMPAAEYQALRREALQLAAVRPLLWFRLQTVGRVSHDALVAFRDGTRLIHRDAAVKLRARLAECYALAEPKPRTRRAVSAGHE